MSNATVGGGPRVVVSTAAFHARVRGSVPGLGGLKETKMFLPHPRVKVSIAGSLRDREVACSASDRQGSNFESCVWRTVSSQSSHHPQEVLLAQFNLYVHKGGLKPDSFHLSNATVPRGPKCLAMCSGGDGCRCRTSGPTRKLTRNVLTNLRGSITDALPNIRRCIGKYSGINWCYIG